MLKSLLDQLSLEVAASSLYPPPFFVVNLCVCMDMKRGHWCQDQDCVPQLKEIEGSVMYASVKSRDDVISICCPTFVASFVAFLCFFFFPSGLWNLR